MLKHSVNNLARAPILGWVWCHLPVILALGSQEQEDQVMNLWLFSVS